MEELIELMDESVDDNGQPLDDEAAAQLMVAKKKQMMTQFNFIEDTLATARADFEAKEKEDKQERVKMAETVAKIEKEFAVEEEWIRDGLWIFYALDPLRKMDEDDIFAKKKHLPRVGSYSNSNSQIFMEVHPHFLWRKRSDLIRIFRTVHPTKSLT